MREYRYSSKLMGSIFEFIFVCNKQSEADKYFNLAVNEISRIENLLSEFKPNSDISKINALKKASKIVVNQETFQMIARANAISKLTQGYFDITMAPLKSIYQFKNIEFNFPDDYSIAKCLESVGYQYLTCLTNNCIELQKDNMSLSLAAIGKGYAADAVKKILVAEGLNHGVISASGDLCAWGFNEKNNHWKVGIANPDNKSQNLLYIPVNNFAVATSGDYEQFFMHNSVKYSHNINPKTGWPCTGIKSVTIISASAELSDALATAVFAMGVKNGLSFIGQLPNTHAIIVDENNQILFTENTIFEYEV